MCERASCNKLIFYILLCFYTLCPCVWCNDETVILFFTPRAKHLFSKCVSKHTNILSSNRINNSHLPHTVVIIIILYLFVRGIFSFFSAPPPATATTSARTHKLALCPSATAVPTSDNARYYRRIYIIIPMYITRTGRVPGMTVAVSVLLLFPPLHLPPTVQTGAGGIIFRLY